MNSDASRLGDPAKPATGIGAVLRKHSRFLAIVGALIVFLTFITKEQRGEALKSLTDSLESAEAQFALQTDIVELFQAQSVSQHTLNERLSGIDQHTLTAEGMSDEHERDSGEIEQDRIRILKEGWRQKIEIAKAYNESDALVLDRTLKFVKKLPPDDELPNQLATELNQREKERDALQKSIGTLSASVDSCGLKQTAAGKLLYTTKGDTMLFELTCDLGAKDKMSSRMALDGKAASEAVKSTIRRVFDQADGILAIKQEDYENTKRWAVGLYVIGWGLSLIGKLYDVKGLGGGD